MNAPYPEPPGYQATPTYCKNNPLNNEYYIEQMKDDPWFPIIKEAHAELSRLLPGYNIVQIKEKFHGLRYYISRGDCTHEVWDANIEEARRVIASSETWVYGFEMGRKYEREANAD